MRGLDMQSSALMIRLGPWFKTCLEGAPQAQGRLVQLLHMLNGADKAKMVSMRLQCRTHAWRSREAPVERVWKERLQI